jgi:solute carrier family 25 (mitochondrial carnitine/acylcarnitine transporter), member 20/29
MAEESDFKIPKYGLFRTLVPGTVGAIFNNYGAYPFDTIRVRTQDPRSKNRSSYSILRGIFSKGAVGGFRDIYRGSTISAIGMVAENSIVFSANRLLKEKLYNIDVKSNRLGQSPLTFTQEMTIGFLSGSLSTVASCPFETIRSNIQVERGEHRRSTILQISRRLGVSGLYRGFTPSYFRNVPFYMLFFPLYSQYADWISKIRGRSYSELGMGSQALAGGLTGATTWFLTYPLDFIKCNQQISPIESDSSMKSIVKRIYRSEGSVLRTCLRMYRGVGLTMIRAFPAAGSLMVGVELANSFVYDE